MKTKLFLLVLACTSALRAVDMTALARHQLVLPETVMAHAAELGFTPEQETRLTAYRDEMKPKIQSLEAAVREEQGKLEAAVVEPTATEAKTAPLLDKLLAAESALKHAQLKVLLELREMLTPEQRAKALQLAGTESKTKQPVEQGLKAKADRLKSAFDELGIQPPEALKEKGAAIEALVRDNNLAAANEQLDALAKEVGLDEATPEAPDFSTIDPGDTNLDTLRQRYDDVTAKAKIVTKLPTLRLLLKGRDELEKAKAAEDAVKVGRVLTWAEGLLKS